MNHLCLLYPLCPIVLFFFEQKNFLRSPSGEFQHVWLLLLLLSANDYQQVSPHQFFIRPSTYHQYFLVASSFAHKASSFEYFLSFTRLFASSASCPLVSSHSTCLDSFLRVCFFPPFLDFFFIFPVWLPRLMEPLLPPPPYTKDFFRPETSTIFERWSISITISTFSSCFCSSFGVCCICSHQTSLLSTILCSRSATQFCSCSHVHEVSPLSATSLLQSAA